MHVSLGTLAPLLGRLTVSVGLVAASVALAPTASATDGTAADDPATTSTVAGTSSGDPTPGSSGATPGTSDPTPDPSSTNPSTPDLTTPDPSSTGPSGTEPSSSTPVPAAQPVVSSGPALPGTPSHSATFRFDSSTAGASYICTLAGPSHAGATACQSPMTYDDLTPGRYSFSVHGTAPAPDGVDGPESATYTWNVFEVYSPDHYSVPAGALFNDPWGTNVTAHRRILTHVIRTIDSMPGYRVDDEAECPSVEAQFPSTIRISLYSMTDLAFAKALAAASRRCVSVQILMNNHLFPETTYAIAYLERHLGNQPFVDGQPSRSFSHRCFYGCRGHGVQHAKMYLFDSALTAPGGTRIADTVMVGSSNMTSNAARVQWNDLYTIRGEKQLHEDYLSEFDRMRLDRVDLHTVAFTDGIYKTVFSPLTPGGADPAMGALRSIHCTGAAAGTGIAGHSVVYISMHAWFGVRGYALAKQVRSMYARGCYVKVLYSFMSASVYKTLTSRAGSRMSVRRTIYPGRDGIHARHYSHLKNVFVEGYVGSNRSARVVWTGSNNFTPDGLVFDEVILRIDSARAYASYVAHFRAMSASHSAPDYVQLIDPIGGGRAIETGV